jgi:hypothetical protein
VAGRLLASCQVDPSTDLPESGPRDLDTALVPGAPSLPCIRAVQITRFGDPEVLDIVDLPDPVPGKGQQLYECTPPESTSQTPTTGRRRV